MKKFLIKISLYAGILVVIIAMVAICFFCRFPKNVSFVSNSVSYNFKAGYIREHPEKLHNARIVVMGSSMSLNNVNTKMLQDSLHLPAVNLSSWALQIMNYQRSPLWGEHKIILCNLGIPDFGPHIVEVKDNFAFNTPTLREVFNLSTDLNTTRHVLQQTKEILAIHDNRHYLSCNFDEYGSVLFSDSGFNIDSARWNVDDYVGLGVDSAKFIDYVERLKNAVTAGHGYARIIISFSPGRNIFYDQKRSGMIAYLGKMIKAACPEVSFIDLYDRPYPDSVYADASHFNVRGATRFTAELIDSIKARHLLENAGILH